MVYIICIPNKSTLFWGDVMVRGVKSKRQNDNDNSILYQMMSPATATTIFQSIV